MQRLPDSPRISTPDLRAISPISVSDLIRVGRELDGGYVVPKRAVAAANVLIGMGIDIDWSFEEAFLTLNPNARLFAIDGTVSAARFRRCAQKHLFSAIRAAFQFDTGHVKDYLWDAREEWRLYSRFRQFFSGRDRVFISRMVGPSRTTESICWADLRVMVEEQAGPSAAIFLKMDIEGAEYDVLPAILDAPDPIVSIAIELHECGREWDRFMDLHERLSRHFTLVHVHGNNYAPLIPETDVPESLELTYVRSDMLSDVESASTIAGQYPLAGLDFPNDQSKTDYKLQFG